MMHRTVPRAAAGHKLVARMTAALPSLIEVLFGSLFWGAGMAITAYFGLGRVNGRIDGHLTAILVLFLAGGVVAFPIAAMAARLVWAGRGPAARFTGSAVCLSLATICTTAALFALDNARFYIGWTDLLSGSHGLIEIGMTVLVSFGAFVILGVRLFLPFGLVVLAIGSLWLAARIR